MTRAPPDRPRPQANRNGLPSVRGRMAFARRTPEEDGTVVTFPRYEHIPTLYHDDVVIRDAREDQIQDFRIRSHSRLMITQVWRAILPPRRAWAMTGRAASCTIARHTIGTTSPA